MPTRTKKTAITLEPTTAIECGNDFGCASCKACESKAICCSLNSKVLEVPEDELMESIESGKKLFVEEEQKPATNANFPNNIKRKGKVAAGRKSDALARKRQRALAAFSIRGEDPATRNDINPYSGTPELLCKCAKRDSLGEKPSKVKADLKRDFRNQIVETYAHGGVYAVRMPEEECDAEATIAEINAEYGDKELVAPNPHKVIEVVCRYLTDKSMINDILCEIFGE